MILSRRVTRVLLVGLLSIVTAGCSSTPHSWTRPGVTESDFKRDNDACVQKASTSGDAVDAKKHHSCLEDMGYYSTDDGKGWHDGHK